MPRETRVDLRDQFHGQLHALAVEFRRIQRAVAEVFVNVPHALAVVCAGHAGQLRAATAQPDGRQPARRDQFVALAEARLQAFHHPRAHAAVLREAHAIDAHRCLQRRLFDQAARRVRPAEQIRQQPAQLRETGLAAVFQQLIETFKHGCTLRLRCSNLLRVTPRLRAVRNS